MSAVNSTSSYSKKDYRTLALQENYSLAGLVIENYKRLILVVVSTTRCAQRVFNNKVTENLTKFLNLDLNFDCDKAFDNAFNFDISIL